MQTRDLIDLIIDTTTLSFNDFVLEQKQTVQGHFFEKLFGLMQRLDLVYPLINYHPVYGAFGNRNYTPGKTDFKKFLEDNINNSNQQGGIDLVLKNNKTNHILCFTFKFFQTQNAKTIPHYDIPKLILCIKDVQDSYPGFTINKGIVTNCFNNTLEDKFNRCLNNYSGVDIQFCQDELEIPFINLKSILTTIKTNNPNNYLEKLILDFNDIPQCNITPRYYQEYLIKRIENIFETKNVALLGAIPRIGKTIVMGKIILAYKHILITSSVVTNIKGDITKFVESSDFNNYKKIMYPELNKIQLTDEPTIIVTSNQALEKNFSDISHKFDFIACDEAHIGCTTEDFKNIIEKISKESTKILYMTATFKKPKMAYNIDIKDCAILGFNEVSILTSEKNRLENKSQIDIIEKVLNRKIQLSEFNTLKYPTIHHFSLNLSDLMIENINNILTENNNSTNIDEMVTFFTNSFTVSGSNFIIQGISQIHNVFDKIFERKNSYVKGKAELTRISNNILKRRPKMLLCYLPAGKTDMKTEDVLPLTEKLFTERYDTDLYYTYIVSSDINENEKKNIKEIITDKVNRNPDKTLIVFVHKMLQTAITLEYCDGVIFMDDSKSEDSLIQRMYRCATYVDGKNDVFILDLNPNRIVNILLDYGIEAGKITDTQSCSQYFRLIENIISIKSTDLHMNYDDNYYNKILLNYNVSSNDQLDLIVSYTVFDENTINIIKNIKNSSIVQNTKIILHNKLGVLEKNSIDENNDIIDKNNETTNVNDTITDIILSTSNQQKETYKKMISKMIYILIVSNLYKKIQTIDNMLLNMDFNTIARISSHHFNITISKEQFIIQIHAYPEILLSKLIIKMNSEMNNSTREKKYKVISSFLIPNQHQKKQNGEVFTPLPLIKEMLDKLPKDVWLNKNFKWLDPAVGIGNFPIIIYERLMISLVDFENESDKSKHILNNMLYVGDICPLNISIYKIIMGYDKDYKGDNIVTQNFLDDKTFKDIKFDVIVGNPPYQSTNANGKSIHGRENLYTKFIRIGLSKLYENGYMLYITPTSWMGPTEILKEMLKCNIIYLNINECKKNFNSIGSTFSYYLINNSYNIDNITTVLCEYNKKIYKSQVKLYLYNFLPQLLSDNVMNIQAKVFLNKNVIFKRKDVEYKKLNISPTKNEIFKYPQIIKHNVKVYSDTPHIHQFEKKLLLFRSGYLKPTYDNLNCGIGDNIMFLLVESDIIGSKLKKLYESKLYTFLLNVNKFSGYNNGKVINMLYNKIEELDVNFTDNDVYEYFNLNPDEIKTIEDNI